MLYGIVLYCIRFAIGTVVSSLDLTKLTEKESLLLESLSALVVVHLRLSLSESTSGLHDRFRRDFDRNWRGDRSQNLDLNLWYRK